MRKTLSFLALSCVLASRPLAGETCAGTIEITLPSGKSEVRTVDVRCPEGVGADLQKQYRLPALPQTGSWSYIESDAATPGEHIARNVEFTPYDRTPQVTTRLRNLHVRGETSCASGMVIHQELEKRSPHGFVSGLTVRPGCQILSATLEWWAYTVAPPN